MIQQAHLTAWQAYAPWPKRSQIEQDLRLSRGVAAIFADPVLGEHLAMRGGTVLHKAHLAPAARYSEDIDLVLVESMDTETLDRHLRRVLTPILGQPSESLVANAWLAMRNVLRPSRILRTAYRFVPLGLRREETIKVEVNLNENASLYALVSVEMDTLVDGAKAMEAFAWYLEKEGTRLGADEANALLDTRLRKASFRRDMDTLLRPGLPKFDVDEGAAVVREAYFTHLRQQDRSR